MVGWDEVGGVAGSRPAENVKRPIPEEYTILQATPCSQN